MNRCCEVKRQKTTARFLYSLMTAAALVAVPALSAAADTRPDTASGTQARMPVLLIGGKENPDVYLQSLDIQVEVTGNIASTRYTMIFKNKTNRMLEGELTFPLPDGRTATHYALDINGKMREAVPVEKAKATQVFEEIQQRNIDPGILERVEGNNFRTRIYPFPRNGTRTISIGYEEELSLEDSLLYYRLPMAYAAPLEKFSVMATVWKNSSKPIVPASDNEIRFDKAGENYVAWFSRTNYRPGRALIFALPAPTEIPQVFMQKAQGSHYFLASVTPKAETRQKQWSDDLAIIWDVSLSGMRRDLKREMEMLDIIFAEKKNANVRLYFLNNRLTRVADKSTKDGEFKVVNGKWSGLKNVLQSAIFDGGTDFSQVKLHNIIGKEILFFSDGLSTLSDADFIKDIKTDRPVHCIVSSPNADYSAMKLIAGKTRGKFVNVNALSSEKLRDELLNETLQFLGTEHDRSVREVYPGIATPVYGNFSVAGITDKNNAEITLLFGFGNKVEKKIKVKLDGRAGASPATTTNNRSVGAPLAGARPNNNVHKIWAQKKIAELDLDYETNRDELTELGKQFGIVTRNTSLIVLELIDDYIQFNIDPPPELRAEYQSRLKWFDERRRATERSLLEDAANAAYNIGNWWGMDAAPKQPKYPVPDSEGSARTAPPPSQPAPIVRSDDVRAEEIVMRSSVAVQGITGQQSPATASQSETSQPTTKAAPPQPKSSQSAQATSSMTTQPKASSSAQAKSSSAAAPAKAAPPPQPKVSSSSKTKSSSQTKASPPKAKTDISRSMAFESAEVIGYLDNPSPVYVVDMDDPWADPIYLDRSFRDALKENMDLFDFGKIDKNENHPRYWVIASSNPRNSGGFSCDPKCYVRVGEDPTVKVTTKANFGFKFTGWSNAPAGVNASDTSITLNVDSDKYLTANFKRYYPEVSANTYYGGTVSINNGVYDRYNAVICKPGSSVTVTAKPNGGYIFSRWRGAPEGVNASDSSITFKITDDVKLLAEFDRYYFYVSATPYNGGEVSRSPNKYYYRPGSKVTTTAKANPGYKFDGWLGAPQGVDASKPTITFKINKSMDLKARFIKHNYMDTLTGNLATDYQLYLKLRNDHANLPSFYFDIAHWFYTRGDKTTALRILTCIAELGLEDAPLYKMLGYRLKEYGEHTLQKFVFGKVVKWRPIEPQSYRDYALALADNGEPQAALDSLHSLLTRRYSTNIANRSRGLEETAIVEINHLIAKYPELNTSKIDKRLLTNVPVDVRVVLNWNMDNIDVDLQVVAPNNRSYYNTGGGYISGDIMRMTPNNRNGYGPEQFLLKNAPRGRYQVVAEYRRAQEFASTAPVTVMAEIYTKYAGKEEVRRIVSMQLSQYSRWDGERALMTEFVIDE